MFVDFKQCYFTFMSDQIEIIDYWVLIESNVLTFQAVN